MPKARLQALLAPSPERTGPVDMTEEEAEEIDEQTEEQQQAADEVAEHEQEEKEVEPEVEVEAEEAAVESAMETAIETAVETEIQTLPVPMNVSAPEAAAAAAAPVRPPVNLVSLSAMKGQRVDAEGKPKTARGGASKPFVPRSLQRSRSSSTVVKSSEERELEEIEKLKKQAAKQRRRSRRSFKRLAQTPEYMPVRSDKPLTRPQEFHFRGSAKKRPQTAEPARDSPSRHGMILRSSALVDKDAPARPVSRSSVTKPRPFKVCVVGAFF